MKALNTCYEDQLPSDTTSREYDIWFALSWVDGVRIGPAIEHVRDLIADWKMVAECKPKLTQADQPFSPDEIALNYARHAALPEAQIRAALQVAYAAGYAAGSTPPEDEVRARYTGIVKWFNEVKGFGMIGPDNVGHDIFAHFSQICGQPKVLREGQKVSYYVNRSATGLQADHIQVQESK